MTKKKYLGCTWYYRLYYVWNDWFSARRITVKPWIFYPFMGLLIRSQQYVKDMKDKWTHSIPYKYVLKFHSRSLLFIWNKANLTVTNYHHSGWQFLLYRLITQVLVFHELESVSNHWKNVKRKTGSGSKRTTRMKEYLTQLSMVNALSNQLKWIIQSYTMIRNVDAFLFIVS